MNFLIVVDPPAHQDAQAKADANVDELRKSRTEAFLKDPDDRRWTNRKALLIAANIESSKQPASVPCLIRNSSSSGVMIEIQGGRIIASDISDRFTLTILSSRSKTLIPCEVAWRSGNRLGARYVGPFQTKARSVNNKPVSKGLVKPSASNKNGPNKK